MLAPPGDTFWRRFFVLQDNLFLIFRVCQLVITDSRQWLEKNLYHLWDAGFLITSDQIELHWIAFLGKFWWSGVHSDFRELGPRSSSQSREPDWPWGIA